MVSKRMLRVNELLRRELGELFERHIVSQLDAVLTVTDVKTSPDLRVATVYVSVFGKPEHDAQALALLKRCRTLLQAELGKRTELKYTPVLRFQLDQSLRQADRVLSILDELDLNEYAELDMDVPPPDDGEF